MGSDMCIRASQRYGPCPHQFIYIYLGLLSCWACGVQSRASVNNLPDTRNGSVGRGVRHSSLHICLSSPGSGPSWPAAGGYCRPRPPSGGRYSILFQYISKAAAVFERARGNVPTLQRTGFGYGYRLWLWLLNTHTSLEAPRKPAKLPMNRGGLDIKP